MYYHATLHPLNGHSSSHILNFHLQACKDTICSLFTFVLFIIVISFIPIVFESFSTLTTDGMVFRNMCLFWIKIIKIPWIYMYIWSIAKLAFVFIKKMLNLSISILKSQVTIPAFVVWNNFFLKDFCLIQLQTFGFCFLVGTYSAILFFVYCYFMKNIFAARIISIPVISFLVSMYMKWNC